MNQKNIAATPFGPVAVLWTIVDGEPMVVRVLLSMPGLSAQERAREYCVHPGEAAHGDLGMLTDKDVVLALSNSGQTDEILIILPVIERLGIPLITLTGNPSSHIARLANVIIDVGVEKEACPLGLAPTTSTTAALVMGDALAVALLDARGFSAQDFARAHPKGRLGRQLHLRLADIMHTG